MIIFPTRSNRPAHAQRGRHRGFTLPEVIIGASLGTIVLAGVLSAFLMLGRSGINVANYSMSESEIRRAMEEFAQDVRMANNVNWNSETSITLTVPGNYTSTSNQVTYAWDSATTGTTAQCFYRKPGNASSTSPSTIFVRNVSNFYFRRFNRLNGSASTNAETKRIQITMNVRRTGQTVVAANTSVVSVSYLLRNKVAN